MDATLTATRKGRFSDIQDWKMQYEKKRTSIEEAVREIRNGDDIALSGAGCFPQALDSVIGDYAKAQNICVNTFSVYPIQAHKQLSEEYKNHVNFYSIFYGLERNLVKQGNVNFIPINLSHTGKNLVDRNPRVTVMTCTPPDENGWMSRTIWGSHIHRDAFDSQNCEVLIVEVNPNYPYLHSCGEKHLMVHVSEVDYIVECDYTWPEIKQIPSTDVEKAVAGYVAELIPDGGCIQLGQGGLADAIGENLVYAGKKDLGLHSEVLGNCVASLMKAGVLNNSRKNLMPGKTVAGAVVGAKELWDFLDNNPDICMREIDWVNDIANIAQNDNVVSINNAMEIDLVGQVASEAIGPRQYTGTGGQLEWVIGSQRSKGGKSIIALNSTYKDKQGQLQSKIKVALPLGSIITTPRTYVQYVVTEHGVANLRYKSTKERANALIAIAHPDFREELRQEAEKFLFA